MCEVVQLLSVVATLCDFSGWGDHSCNRTQEYIIKVWGVFDKMISTHLVGTESDLQCCYGGEGLADIFPAAVRS